MRLSDEIMRRPAQQARKPKVDIRLPLVRDGALPPLRSSQHALRDELSVSEIVHAATGVANRPGAFLIGGGDPLRRSDLLEVLQELTRIRPAALGLYSAGRGVTTAVVQRLQAAGVQRMQIPFHCARQDGHDWLVAQTGALKTAHRAIRACVAVGMPVTAETIITRPTMLHLAETVDVLTRLGVRALRARRVTADETGLVEFVPLSARLELLEKSLEQAATIALERRAILTLHDLPLCVAPRLRPLFAPPDCEIVVLPDGSVQSRADTELGCALCPGLPHCAGAPPDYVSRFGWEELINPLSAAARISESVTDQQRIPTSAPMAFTWRGPHRLRCEACAQTEHEQSIAQPPYESTRVVRARLVEAARYRPSVLRLVGADLLAHPQAAALLYDAVRLFTHVEVAGEASAIVDYTDLDLRRLKELRRIDVALFGPDAATHDAHCGIPGAFAATLRGIERVRGQTQIPVGAYALLHDARWVPAFAEGWSRGGFPGAPRFRLSPRGSSLEELVQCARVLPPGPARTALLAVLPQCLVEPDGLASERNGESAAAMSPTTAQQRIHSGRSLPYQPCGSDPIGAFEMCHQDVGTCARIGCAGTAVGWQSRARSQQWSSSNSI